MKLAELTNALAAHVGRFLEGPSPERADNVTPVIYEVVGWLGAVLVVGAYWWVTKWGTSFYYHVANLLGAAGLLANALHHHALPSTAVNLVWLVIALVGMRQARLAQ